MRRYILPLILSFIIAFLAGGLSLLYYGAGESISGPTFEGTQLLVPDDAVLVTLAAQGTNFASVFTDRDGNEVGFVTLNKDDAEAIGNGKYVIPFAVDRGGTGIFVYVGLFEPNTAGVFEHKGSLFLGDRILLKDIEIRNTRSLVIRFLTHEIGQAMTDTPATDAIVFGTTFGEKLEESYKIVNGSFGDIFFESPAPGEVLSPGPYLISGETRGSWFFEANAPIELRDLQGNLLASALAAAEGEWMTEELVPFSAEITVPEDYSGEAILVFKKDNPSSLPGNDAELSERVFIEVTPAP